MTGNTQKTQQVQLDWGNALLEIHGDPKKPWITLLHSLATSKSLWREQLASLKKTHRILAVDFRGHGGTDISQSQFNVTDLASDVVSIWDALGINRSSVAGTSLGGMTALELAIRHPKRVMALIVIGCRASADGSFCEFWQHRRDLLERQGKDALIAATLPTWLTESSLRHNAELVEAVSEMIQQTPHEGYCAATRALERLDCADGLKKIRARSMLLVGSDDGPHPAIMSEMAEHIPNCKFHIVPGSSHMVNLEKPHEVNLLISQFLREDLLNVSNA